MPPRGKDLTPRLPHSATVEERFWAKVEQRGPEECWPWLAGRNKKGYGKFGLRTGVMVPAHRWAYANCVRPLEDGETIDHLCRNPSCQNPAHMEPVTLQANVQRGQAVRKYQTEKTHCPQGHPYGGENLHRYGSRRICRTCKREGQQALRAQKRT